MPPSFKMNQLAHSKRNMPCSNGNCEVVILGSVTLVSNGAVENKFKHIINGRLRKYTWSDKTWLCYFNMYSICMHVGSHAWIFIVKFLPATQKAFRVHHSSSWVLCTSHPEVLHTRPHKRLCSFDLPATQPTHSPTKEVVVRQLWVCFITVEWARVSSSLPSLSQHMNHACSFSGRFPWHCLLHSIDEHQVANLYIQ